MPHNVSILLLNGIDKMVLWIQEYSISISFEQYTVHLSNQQKWIWCHVSKHLENCILLECNEFVYKRYFNAFSIRSQNIGDFVLIKWAPPTLEIEQNHKNCKGVQSSGTMHQHLNWYAQNASHGDPEWFKYQKLIKHFHVFLNILSNG